MQLARLVETFQRIEATTRRHETTSLLASLFRSAPEDARVLPYLLQGRLGPPCAAPDLGVDERRIADALAAATDVPLGEVWRLYKQRGDLGLVAEQLLPPAGQPVSIQEAYAAMRWSAATTGPGSLEEKVGLLGDLLRKLGGPEARYVARMAQGRLRLGIGDATILDALLVACAGDTRLRPRIERAYSLCSDLGLIAETLLAEGPEALDEIHPSPGRPVLSALAGRLPSPEEVVRKLGRIVAEPKYDGLRLQAHKQGSTPSPA